MTATDIAKAADIATSSAHKDAWHQSWAGTLVGQSVVAVVAILAYVAALAAILTLWKTVFAAFHADYPILFYALISIMPLLILIFLVIPAIRRAIRENQLHKITPTDSPASGIFRLAPYEAEDRERYFHPSGSDTAARAWLETTPHSILYLAGASGTGKSSLVQAALGPALTDAGWRVVFVRGMGEPLTSLTAKLRASAELYRETPPETAQAHALLSLAADEVTRTQSGPLLIILDQFEEYLILEGGEEKTAYAAFLNALDAAPIPNVRLLHVFRQDYQSLLFKENLPRYRIGENAFELAPFSRREAQAFLKSGPQQLDETGYDRLFAGLDRIEETRGIYRPITLNMIGYVLDREGTTLATDPGRLIQRYLRNCVCEGPSRDFAKPVLEAMITREGTKEAQSETALTKGTGIETWQVQSTLAGLQQDGLVRPLPGDIWEISHDFIARQLGQILGRLRPPMTTRLALPVLGVTSVALVATLIFGLPVWMKAQALDDILALGMTRDYTVVDGVGFKVDDRSGFDDDDLAVFAEKAGLFDLTSIDLGNAHGITSLEPLKGMPITSINLEPLDARRHHIARAPEGHAHNIDQPHIA